MVIFYCSLMVLIIQLTGVISDTSHFSVPCHLCECFTIYADRAQNILLRPYATANDYNTTESECLAACLRENERCKGVVYGVLGNREVFLCELHQRIKLTKLVYVPYSKVYVKKQAKCATALYDRSKPQALQNALMNRKPTFKRKHIGYHL